MTSTSASTATSPLRETEPAAAFGDRLHHGVGRFRVLAVIDGDRPAVLSGEQRTGAADAARGAGDKKDFGGHV